MNGERTDPWTDCQRGSIQYSRLGRSAAGVADWRRPCRPSAASARSERACRRVVALSYCCRRRLAVYIHRATTTSRETTGALRSGGGALTIDVRRWNNAAPQRASLTTWRHDFQENERASYAGVGSARCLNLRTHTRTDAETPLVRFVVKLSYNVLCSEFTTNRTDGTRAQPLSVTWRDRIRITPR